MSGHSKWHTIKRKKGAQDAKRGQEFTKLGNAIAVAAREGDDPDTNFKLRLAIDKAKEANMPNSNIDKAIARGSGKLGGEQIQEVVYEGYGPGGVAVIVEGVTDNKNRTSSDVRSTFGKNGGNLAETGAVAYQFDHQGIITIDTDDPDMVTLEAIDAGAEDIFYDEGMVTIYTKPKELKAVQGKLENHKVISAELGFVPKQTLVIEDKATAQRVVRLMDALEELDDVTNTYTNFDVAEGVI